MQDIPRDILGVIKSFVGHKKESCGLCCVCKRWAYCYHLKHVHRKGSLYALWTTVVASPSTESTPQEVQNDPEMSPSEPTYEPISPRDRFIDRLIEFQATSVTLGYPFTSNLSQTLLELADVPSLRELEIKFSFGDVIDDKTYQNLAFLVKTSSLSKLSIDFEDRPSVLPPLYISPDNFHRLMDLFSCTTLISVHLGLNSCSINDEFLTILVNRCLQASSVNDLSLNLSKNNLTDESMPTLTTLLSLATTQHILRRLMLNVFNNHMSTAALLKCREAAGKTNSKHTSISLVTDDKLLLN